MARRAARILRGAMIPYLRGGLPHIESEFCGAGFVPILAISAKPCQQGEADPRGLRR
jgi:hypothetical protein